MKTFPFTMITITKPTAENALFFSVCGAFEIATAKDFLVSPEIASIVGMSGQRYRRFINSLIHDLHDPRYLEIGSWAGSTLCSAVFSNSVTALAIDNWSEFGGPVGSFFANVSKVVNDKNRVSVINADFRAVNYSALGKFNVYLFDGPHEEQDHYDGIALPLEALDEEFILVVDDWNWRGVRSGTHGALKRCNLNIEACIEVRTTSDDSHPGDHGLATDQDSDWHNGYFIAVIKKRGAVLT